MTDKTTAPVHWGPFRGMRFRHDVVNPDPSFVYFARNMMPESPTDGGPYRRRANFLQLITGAGATIQECVAFPTAGLNVQINGGEVWAAVGAGAWSKYVSAAQLTTAGITLHSTARVYAIEFAGQLVVSDGINTPFLWDGTLGGGLTLLSNAPVFFGRPTVYYGKLFGIKSAERNTIVWSEENQANVGYEQVGYNNAWTLTQSGSGPLFALKGTNDALYYWRKGNIASISGAVNSAFVAAGTQPNISTDIGTVAPGSVVSQGNNICFMDGYGRPWIYNGSLIPVWEEIRDAIPNNASPDAPFYQAALVPEYQAVAFWYNFPGSSAAPLSHAFVVHIPTGHCLAQWDLQTGFDVRVIGTGFNTSAGAETMAIGAHDGSNRTTLVIHPSTASIGTDADAYTVVTPPTPWVGGLVSQWDGVEVEFDVGPHVSSSDAGIDVTANVTEALTTAPAITVGQTSVTHGTTRATKRRELGMNRESRRLQIGLAETTPLASVGDWGVHQITVRRQPRRTYPQKT